MTPFSLNQIFQGQPSIAAGLDIGTRSSKMVVLKKTAGRLELLHWSIEPIDQGDEKASVKSLLKKVLINPFPCRTALFGRGTLLRVVETTRMSASELKKSFAFEADRYFPFPAKDVFMDCAIIDNKRKDNKMTVLIAVAKKELVNERLKLLKEIGLTADHIGLNAIALANALAWAGPSVASSVGHAVIGNQAAAASLAPSVAILDIGEMESNLTIHINSVPRFSRDFYIGGRELTRCITNVKSVPLEVAEKLKAQGGPEILAILESSDSPLFDILTELRLSFDYFTTEHKVQPAKLLITGGASGIPGIVGLMTKHLDLNVEQFNPFAKIKPHRSFDQKDWEGHLGELAVALGLALSHFQ